MNYYWIRIYDFDFERDNYDKGIMLDEFYIKGENLTREETKEKVKEKYINEIKFAKPRKKNGMYAIVMDSDKFFYDRFYLEIDTYCFCCHKEIKGKASEFPKESLKKDSYEIDLESSETVYYCSYDCKNKLHNNLRYEGEFQEKEAISSEIVGYIYHMYNRVENKHYIGQTKFLPFFRWQEHIKAGEKGNITDITFDVITEVKKKRGEDGQELLNNIEAWWIQKYISEGYEVFNISVPKLSIEYYKKNFEEMINNNNNKQLELI